MVEYPGADDHDQFMARRHAHMQAEMRAMQERDRPGKEWPVWVSWLLTLAFIGAGALVVAALDTHIPKRPDPQIEIDSRHLDCRMTGNSWEYFGTLGWQCVPVVKP